MEIKELQSIYATHPGVKALSALTDEDYERGITLSGLTTGSAAATVIAGYMPANEKSTLFIVMHANHLLIGVEKTRKVGQSDTRLATGDF